MQQLSNGKRPRRRMRYVLLLTPSEMALLRAVAAREYRTLPDFLRTQIYARAKKLGVQEQMDRSSGGEGSGLPSNESRLDLKDGAAISRMTKRSLPDG